jgi:hypothetical protein
MSFQVSPRFPNLANFTPFTISLSDSSLVRCSDECDINPCFSRQYFRNELNSRIDVETAEHHELKESWEDRLSQPVKGQHTLSSLPVEISSEVSLGYAAQKGEQT